MPDSAFRPGSDEEWQALLRQLRRSAQAQPPPFFYARVRTRLLARADTAQVWLTSWLRWPAYAAVLGALVLTVSGDGTVAAPAYRSAHSIYPAQRPAP